jgi:diguanylate cyclase (GGDEF)-like protein
MRLFGRSDLLPAAGLTVALIVVFSRPVSDLLDYAREIEQTLGLRLVPALAILGFVFMAHQVWKRQEVRARTLIADAEVREATARAADLTRLVALGQALARTLDQDSIRVAASAQLPLLLPGREVWSVLRSGTTWQTMLVIGDSTQEQREAAAVRALDHPAVPGDLLEGYLCFPMVVADVPIGVFGVSPAPAMTPHQQSMVATAAALLAVSVKNAELFREVRDSSVRDGLTGCFTRAHAMNMLDAELRRARRAETPVTLIMFDLDHFKSINDSYGHLCGDAVLTAVGARMRAVLRGADLKCRYGGEEFLVMLPDTPLAGAHRVAETLRRDLEQHSLRWRDEIIRITASFGIAEAEPSDLDALTTVARADEALYFAKQSGRNCIRTADDLAAGWRNERRAAL